VSHFTADKHRTNQSHRFSRSKISIMMCELGADGSVPAIVKFISRVNIHRNSVRMSIRNAPVLDENGLTYRHYSFFTMMIR